MLLFDEPITEKRYAMNWPGKNASIAEVSRQPSYYGPYQIECRASNLKQLMYLGGSIPEFWQIMLQAANEMEKQNRA